MIDPDELMEELEENQENIEALIRRSKAHDRDINAMREALEDLKEDIEAENTISPEQWGEHLRSGVAQS